MSQGRSGLNKVKASVFRRWPVTAPYRGEQTTQTMCSLSRKSILSSATMHRTFT